MKRIVMMIIMFLLLTGCNAESSSPPELDSPVYIEETAQVEAVVPETVEFRVTAYCACEKCCGKWALNRPVDENGNKIVYGASGEVLITNVSCASTYQFGTIIELDGYGTVVVEDRTADWIVDKYGDNVIDIYFDNHQDALEFGVQYIEGVVINEEYTTSRNNLV